MPPRKARRAFFLILVALSVALLAAIMWPLAAAIFVGSVLAGALHPLHERLSLRLGDRPRLSAGMLTVGVLVAVIVPLAVVGTIVVGELVQAAAFVRSTLESDGVRGLVAALPDAVRPFGRAVVERVPFEDLELSQVSAQGERAAAWFGRVLAATSGVVLQTLLMLILLFFLLVDGRALVQWLCEIVPMRGGQLRALLIEFRKVSHAVLVSSLATAAVQTVVALAGYLLAGVPQPVFFAFVTFVFAFVPVIGAGGIALVVSLLMLLLGHPVAAGFLALWAVFVVGLADNVVKPWLIHNDLQMHGAVVFFSLLGGLAFFGPIGLIAGPMVVTFFLSVVRIHMRSVADPQAAPPPSTMDHDSDTASEEHGAVMWKESATVAAPTSAWGRLDGAVSATCGG